MTRKADIESELDTKLDRIAFLTSRASSEMSAGRNQGAALYLRNAGEASAQARRLAEELKELK